MNLGAPGWSTLALLAACTVSVPAAGAEKGRELSSVGGAATDRVGCVGFAPDGRFALSGSSDSVLRLWKLSK